MNKYLKVKHKNKYSFSYNKIMFENMNKCSAHLIYTISHVDIHQ